jgi:8-oxo-dGTP pyrophosphatase MutT (NUDIX family)
MTFIQRCDSIRNAGFRLAYRIAYPIVGLWIEQCDSALTAVWVQDKLLLVRHSYKPGLAMPGGGIKSGEELASAARRELWEEVGIDADPERLVRRLSLTNRQGARYHLFELELETIPELHIDYREIIFASFLPVDVFIKDCRDTRVLAYIRARCAALTPIEGILV